MYHLPIKDSRNQVLILKKKLIVSWKKKINIKLKIDKKNQEWMIWSILFLTRTFITYVTIHFT